MRSTARYALRRYALRQVRLLPLLAGALALAGAVEARGRGLPAAARQPLPGKQLRLDRKDPEPLVTRDYLDVTVTLQQGRIKVERLRPGRFARPQLIRRFRGRHEIRLYRHAVLRDVVRFSFPLTLPAGERTGANIRLDRALADGVKARAVVRVPLPEDITHAVLLDTRLGLRVPIDLAPVLAPPLRIELPAPGGTR